MSIGFIEPARMIVIVQVYFWFLFNNYKYAGVFPTLVYCSALYKLYKLPYATYFRETELSKAKLFDHICYGI